MPNSKCIGCSDYYSKLDICEITLSQNGSCVCQTCIIKVICKGHGVSLCREYMDQFTICSNTGEYK